MVSGELFAPVVPDECTFVLEDGPDADARRVIVTLTKATTTTSHEHWRSVVRGEAEIDPSRFGPKILTVDPTWPHAPPGGM